MGRLDDIALDAGITMEALASAVGVPPLLLWRIDVGVQPLPRDLAAELASALGADVHDVLAAAVKTTDIQGPRSRRPSPLRLGEVVQT